MKENLFTTSIPIYVIVVFVIAVFLIALELRCNTKGVLGIIGGLCEVLGVVLSFMSGVVIEELIVMLLINGILIMLLMSSVRHREGK